MWKRLLGADQSWGAATGLLLLLGFGTFIVFISVADLREAARVQPEARTCASWLKDPSGPRWVSLRGCKLDLSAAASRRWKGWQSVRDGGVSGERFLELFIPLAAEVGDEGPVRGVLATTDAKLLTLVNGINATRVEDVQDYLRAHEAELDALLNPEVLTGYVEPVKSVAAVSALDVLMADDAVVLEQGRAPPRANAVFGVLVGLLCVAVAVRSIGRRLLLERDSSLD